MSQTTKSLIIAAGVFALAVSTTRLEAQATGGRRFGTGMRTGIGYSAALPDAQVGAGAFHFIGATRAGVFADWKMTAGSLKGHDNYCPAALMECNASWVEQERNDFEVRSEDEWLAFNAGAIYAVTSELAILLGGGVVRRTRIREYFHETDSDVDRITPDGNYFVDDPESTGWVAQAVTGAMLRAGRSLVFRFGYETAPGGMSVGIYWVLP